MNSLKKLRLAITLIILGFSFAAVAQEEEEKAEPTFSLSGSIDTYYHTSLGKQNDQYGSYAPTTAFSNLRGFGLGMANLIASYNGEKVGFVADLVFGPRGTDAVFNSGLNYPNAAFGSSGQIINQLYSYVKLSDAVTINLGQFNTFVGYEVISPTVNVNYSTSYLFSNGPFSHTGLRADFSFGEGMVAKLAVMNPTDFLQFNPVNTYTLGGQIGKTFDGGGVWLNAVYGDQDGKLDEDVDGDGDASAGKLFQVDLTGGFSLSETFYLGFNASYQTVGEGEIINGGEIEDLGNDATSFMGVALYPKFTLSEAFALGLRAEYFAVTKDHTLASAIEVDDEGDGNVLAFTLSGNYKLGSLTLIPEVRYDKLSEENGLFFEKDGTATDNMLSLTLAAVYKF